MKKNYLLNILKHFNTVNKHRLEVCRLCFKCGLYYRGLTHDLSKYSPTEFFEGVKYFNGDHSPILDCRKETGKSEAWLHHKGRNKHHPEYWIDDNLYVMMPYQYVVESICDRIAAAETYSKKNYKTSIPYEYWAVRRDKGFKINEKTSKFYDKVFKDYEIYGEKILNKKYMKETFDNICK